MKNTFSNIFIYYDEARDSFLDDLENNLKTSLKTFKEGNNIFPADTNCNFHAGKNFSVQTNKFMTKKYSCDPCRILMKMNSDNKHGALSQTPVI